jgi:hypothetical protein
MAGALGVAVIAILLCGLGMARVYDTIVLAAEGRVVEAEVVDVQYGGRGDFVRVHLPAPPDRDVELIRETTMSDAAL